MSIESPAPAKSKVSARSESSIVDGPPADWRGSVRVADVALLLAFLVLTFLLGIFPLKDTDFWWHLRTGDLIRETGKVPRTDIFLFTREGAPWIDLHWGFQVAISWVYEWGKVVGVNLAKCVVTTLAVFFLITARKREWPIWVMTLAWIPALLVLSGRMYVRPETLTLLFLAIELAILHRWDRYPRIAWLLPLNQLVWVNCHGLFVFGPIVLSMALIDATLRRGAFSPGRGSWWKTILSASVVTLIVCLINPYGLFGAIFPLELASTMNNPIFNDNIAELKSIPSFIEDAGLRNVPLLLQLATIIVGGLSFLIPLIWQILQGFRREDLPDRANVKPTTEPRRKKSSGKNAKSSTHTLKKKAAAAIDGLVEDPLRWRLSPFRFLLFVALSLLSLKATRNSHQFAAVVGTVTAWNFGEWAAVVRRSRDRLVPRSDATGQSGTSWLLPRLSALGVLGVLFLAVAGGWFYELCGEKRTVGLGEEKLWYPHEAAKFVGSPGMPDRFIGFHIGHVSLMEYYNGPQKKAYADARLEVVGPDLFRSYLELENQLTPQPRPDRISWESQLDTLGRPSVLVEHELHAQQGAVLLASSHWKCVWFDLVAAVFVHDSSTDAVRDYEVDFATRHFRKEKGNEPRDQVELLALAKGARNYVNALSMLSRPSLIYPLLWAGLESAQRVIQLSPKTSEAWKFLGQIEMNRPQATASASRDFSMNFDPIRHLSSSRAQYALRRADELLPDDLTTVMAIAQVSGQSRILDRAKGALERTLKMRPINKAQSNTIPQTIETIRKILEEMGEAPGLEWRNLGEFDSLISRLIASGRIESLASVLERAYPVDRAQWEEIDRLATTRLSLGEPERARELWSRAKEPGIPGLRAARIAATYLAEAEFDQARTYYLEATQAAPDLYEAHYGLAVLEEDAGNADEASDHALKAMDVSKNDKSQVRFSAARGIAGRVSRFLTRGAKEPAIPASR